VPTTTPKPPVGRRTGKPDPRLPGLPSWPSLVEEHEHVPELQHPISVDTWNQVSKATQVASLLRLFKSPIHNYSLRVVPNAADRKVVAQVAHVLGIPMDGEQLGRQARARRVELIGRGLRALTLGHAVFEIEGVKTGPSSWELLNLHYLSPRSLRHWQFRGNSTDIERIDQDAPGGTVPLPANRLAALRYDLDPDMPYGESMLRPLYQPWLIQDRLARIGIVSAERNGMGVPVVFGAKEAAPGDGDENHRLASGVAAGETTGFGLPHDGDFKIVGVDGNTFDILAYERYQDEKMSRLLAGQIINLGTTQTGSRSVGDNHADLLWEARDAAVEWLCDQLAAQILHRACIWNGHDPQDLDGLPSIEATRPEVVEPLGPEDWKALVDAGLIDPADEGQRREFERRYNLPERTVVQVAVPEASATIAAAAATDTGLVKGVPQARRKLNAVEQAAHWPFAELEAAWVAARDQLAALWTLTRRQMISAAVGELATVERLHERVDELHELARTTALTALTPQVVGRIADAAAGLAVQAAEAVRGAVRAQGAVADGPDVEYLSAATRSAKAAGQTVALTVADQVARSTARLAAPGVPSAQVAALVEQDMATLTDALPRQVAGAEATRAQHAGQAAVIEPIWDEPDVASAYYSSLLDGATCGACGRRDGHEYQDMGEVRSDFPSGGYRACEGGDRCRCTWVFVLTDETPASVGIEGDA
jgi:hypothetical protein